MTCDDRRRMQPSHANGDPCGSTSASSRNFAKVGVEGSNPFARSKFERLISHLRPVVLALPTLPDFGEAQGKQAHKGCALQGKERYAVDTAGRDLHAWPTDKLSPVSRGVSQSARSPSSTDEPALHL